MLKEVGIDETYGAFVERAVDGNYIALRNKIRHISNPSCFDRFLGLCKQQLVKLDG